MKLTCRDFRAKSKMANLRYLSWEGCRMVEMTKKNAWTLFPRARIFNPDWLWLPSSREDLFLSHVSGCPHVITIHSQCFLAPLSVVTLLPLTSLSSNTHKSEGQQESNF